MLMFTNLEINNDDNNEDIICPASLLCTVLPLTVLITLLSTITAGAGDISEYLRISFQNYSRI